MTTTRAPSAASRRATAAPIPAPAPVNQRGVTVEAADEHLTAARPSTCSPDEFEDHHLPQRRFIRVSRASGGRALDVAGPPAQLMPPWT